MAAFLASFLFVLLAEMGDKTQLLAMAFAAKYRASQVLLAVFLATTVNHALAVLFGHFLTTIVPLAIISFVAALSFVGFGLWTIRGDTLEGEEKRQTRFGPVVTVAVAFFLAEMGDKTQLATISLAVKYRDMLNVLAGTTLAMVAADGVGIVVGIVMRKHIPERTIKWVSAAIFILFGLIGIYQTLAGKVSGVLVWGVVVVVLSGAFIGAWHLAARERSAVGGASAVSSSPGKEAT